MKLYNPRKPHLVQFSDGTFGIRRIGIDGWEFLSHTGNYWYSTDDVVSSSCHLTATQADDLMRDPLRADRQRVEAEEIKKDKGRPLNTREILLGYTLLCILAYGAWTAIAVCIAWPIINWMANGFGG